MDSLREALVDCLDYLREVMGDDAVPAPPDKEDTPSRRTMLRGVLRLDIVSILLFHRELTQWLDKPGTITSIHLYTDGSPVTGLEIQAIILDIILCTGAVHRWILPAMCLTYGMAGALDKALALCWCIF